MDRNVKAKPRLPMQLLVKRPDGTGLTSEDTEGIEVQDLIVSGERSDSPYHAWRCAYYLGWDASKTRYALGLINYGDPPEGNRGGDEKFEIEWVAIMRDPTSNDEDGIVRYLMMKYQDAGGIVFEMIDEIGRFKLSHPGDDVSEEAIADFRTKRDQ